MLQACSQRGVTIETIMQYRGNKDFHAKFDGKQWTVEWTWKGDTPVLKNRVGCYEYSLRGECAKSRLRKGGGAMDRGRNSPAVDRED